MTDWAGREFTLSFDFLDNGIYKAALCQDGINAESYSSDYVIKTNTLKKGDQVKIKTASGGGFLLKLIKQGQ